MAVLNSRERGQLLLLGAVVIGFVIVTLSLTLNGGLYAETIAGEAVDDVSNDETRYLLANVRGDVGWLISRAIAAHPSTFGEQEDYVEQNVSTLNDQYREYYTRSDASVYVKVDSVKTGTRYTGNLDGPYRRFPISNRWVRNVTLTVSGTDAGTTELMFTDDDGDSYTVEMSDNVEVEGYPGSTPACAASGDYTVNVSAATVDGEPCPALEFGPEFDGPYTVEFTDDEREGTYSITANDTEPGDPPGISPVVYSADINVTHRTSTTNYTGTIRVAPGEIS